MRPRSILPLAALSGFVLLLILVAVDWAPLVGWDTATSAAARRHGAGNPAWVAELRFLTDAASTVTFLTAGAAFTVVLLSFREYDIAVATAIVTGTVPAVWGVLHAVLHRPRPTGAFVSVASNGFPSGHTAHATAAGLLGVLLLWPQLRRGGRVVAVVLAAGAAGFIGYSRVALLAHWPSDVVGGILLGLGIVPLAVRLTARAARPPAPGSTLDSPALR